MCSVKMLMLLIYKTEQCEHYGCYNVDVFLVKIQSFDSSAVISIQNMY